MIRPVLLGYQSLRIDSSIDAVENGLRALRAFADREGFSLGDTYTEYQHTGTLHAYEALLRAVGAGGVAAVAVPSPADLGRMPRVRQFMRQQIQDECGVPVLIVQEFASADLGAMRRKL